MTTTDSSPEPQAAPAQRSWQLALLTPAEPARRNRRPIDAALLGVAAIVIGPPIWGYVSFKWLERKGYV